MTTTCRVAMANNGVLLLGLGEEVRIGVANDDGEETWASY